MNIKQNEIHVWEVKFDHYSKNFNYDQLLSLEEKLEAERFVNDTYKHHYILTHYFLRIILSYYLKTDPQDFVFFKNNHGKPYLKDIALKFNLSHAKNLVRYAICGEQDVGVDIEWIDETIDWQGLAFEFFTKSEIITLKKPVINTAGS